MINTYILHLRNLLDICIYYCISDNFTQRSYKQQLPDHFILTVTSTVVSES